MGNRIDWICLRALGWGHCALWKQNLVLLVSSLVATILGLRMVATVGLYIVPLDSWAGERILQAYLTPWSYFLATAGMASMGGVVSLLHKLRGDKREHLDFLAACGHMSASQFAGLLGYFTAMEMNWSSWIGLTMCGLFGWGGNKVISKLNDMYLARHLRISGEP